jgi:hypothetical protein
MVATPVLLLVQVPPAAPLDDSVTLVGELTVCRVKPPLLPMVPGLRSAFTVTSTLLAQPVLVIV